MKTACRWQAGCMAGVALALSWLSGCQTYHISGMTLPSGHYLQHPPQYFVPSPVFPLSKELASMEAQEALTAKPAPAAALPPQVPPQAPPPPAAPAVLPPPGGAQ
jgi:hypothetical protein